MAHAFFRRRNIDVVILYPSGRVSELQEKQLTTLGENVHALEVSGSFDDCQRLVKEAFQDTVLRSRLRLTSANSINVGRLLPQSLYYVFGASRRGMLGGRAPIICVPSGNFGNLTAGVYAWHWGLSVEGFIAATNSNDIVPRYLRTGRFVPRPSEKTLSNAMDVGNPSNFERLEEVFRGDWRTMAAKISGISESDDRTLEVMGDIALRYGTLVDPHTAVGIAAAGSAFDSGLPKEAQVIVLSTAHPGSSRRRSFAPRADTPIFPKGWPPASPAPGRQFPSEKHSPSCRGICWIPSAEDRGRPPALRAAAGRALGREHSAAGQRLAVSVPCSPGALSQLLCQVGISLVPLPRAVDPARLVVPLLIPIR